MHVYLLSALYCYHHFELANILHAEELPQNKAQVQRPVQLLQRR